MLLQQKQSKWLFSRLKQVMIEECYRYRMNEQPQPDADFDAKIWERFIDIAQSNIKMSQQCLAPLAEIAEYWGINKVRHYEWASMGRKYCKVLSAAASQNPIWEEALVKLNQLLLRRIIEGRSLRDSVNPLYLLDLERLVAWPEQTNFERKGRQTYTLKYEPITASELPAGYTFDRYGLIVASRYQLAPIARATIESESLLCLDDSDGGFAGSTNVSMSIPPSQLYRTLQIAALVWCVLLAALSWWYRRI